MPEILHVPAHTVAFPWLTPCSILVVGPTQSGKTWVTKRIIRERKKMFLPAPQSVLYAYSAWQDAYNDMTDVTFHRGLPTSSQLKPNSLVILDDVMQEATSSPDVLKLFTVDVHHRNISILFLLQNLYFQSRFLRTLNLNSQYLMLFGNKRDKLQMNVLARQMYPGQTKYFMDSFEDSTSQPHGYLVCDLHPTSDKRFQLRTKIFPRETPWVYLPL